MIGNIKKSMNPRFKGFVVPLNQQTKKYIDKNKHSAAYNDLDQLAESLPDNQHFFVKRKGNGELFVDLVTVNKAIATKGQNKFEQAVQRMKTYLLESVVTGTPAIAYPIVEAGNNINTIT